MTSSATLFAESVAVFCGLAGDECVEVIEERRVVELGVEVRQCAVASPAIWPVGLETADHFIESRRAMFECEPQIGPELLGSRPNSYRCIMPGISDFKQLTGIVVDYAQFHTLRSPISHARLPPPL